MTRTCLGGKLLATRTDLAEQADAGKLLHVPSNQVLSRQVVPSLHVHLPPRMGNASGKDGKRSSHPLAPPLPVVRVCIVQRLQEAVPEYQASCPVGILHSAGELRRTCEAKNGGPGPAW